MSNYPGGVSGSHPYFNQPDVEERRCDECAHCKKLMVHDGCLGFVCGLMLDVSDEVVLLGGAEPAGECFEERGDR